MKEILFAAERLFEDAAATLNPPLEKDVYQLQKAQFLNLLKNSLERI